MRPHCQSRPNVGPGWTIGMWQVHYSPALGTVLRSCIRASGQCVLRSFFTIYWCVKAHYCISFFSRFITCIFPYCNWQCIWPLQPFTSVAAEVSDEEDRLGVHFMCWLWGIAKMYLNKCVLQFLDGTDITDLNVSWLRHQMGLVSQEPVLFNQSVKENIL